MSLGDLERSLEAEVKTLQGKPILLFLVDAVSKSISSLQQEETALYDLVQSKVWYASLPQARGAAVLFPDIITQILFVASVDTRFIARHVVLYLLSFH